MNAIEMDNVKLLENWSRPVLNCFNVERSGRHRAVGTARSFGEHCVVCLKWQRAVGTPRSFGEHCVVYLK